MNIGYYMEMPSRCPICSEPMVNNYAGNSSNAIVLSKRCDKMVSHRIDFLSYHNNHNEVYWASLSITPKMRAVWHFDDKTLFLKYNAPKVNGKRVTSSDINLPWVDPDFDNYQKLVTKLKTYAIFS